MDRKRIVVLFGAALAGASACKRTPSQASGVKEDLGYGSSDRSSPNYDPWNPKADGDPMKLGLKEMTFNELTQPVNGASPLRGTLPVMPWVDSYWPAHSKDIAARYIDKREFMHPKGQERGPLNYVRSKYDDSNEYVEKNPDDPDLGVNQQIRDAQAAIAGQFTDAKAGRATRVANLSPAEKYDYIMGDTGWSTVKDSWLTYRDVKSTPNLSVEIWRSAGICNGWAPAAVREGTPWRNVLAKKGGREILFYEGDIRALVSRLYYTNETDGGVGNLGLSCPLSAAELGRTRDRFGRPVGKTNEHGYDFEGTACRDVNPAAFQMMFAQRLAETIPVDERAGFVMERDRTSEVWNQPVFAYQSVFGRKTMRAQVPQAEYAIHHPKFAYLIDVQTFVAFIAEPPRGEAKPEYDKTQYKVDFNSMTPEYWNQWWPTRRNAEGMLNFPGYTLARYVYRLEFDDQNKLVGGEWADKAGQALQPAPDVLWETRGKITSYFKRPAAPDGSGKPDPAIQPIDSFLKADVIKKLLECSRVSTAATARTSYTRIVGNQLQYITAVDCDLDG